MPVTLAASCASSSACSEVNLAVSAFASASEIALMMISSISFSPYLRSKVWTGIHVDQGPSLPARR